MRINQYVALATGLSRRKADALIASGRVQIGRQAAQLGQDVTAGDEVRLDDRALTLPTTTTIMLNKPVGYVVSREGQGSLTTYDLLPPEYHHLKPIGRLDKDSSGLLLLTNSGKLAQELTHPSFIKEKVYEVTLDKALLPADQTHIEQGVSLTDGPSRLQLKGKGSNWAVTMHEGRNRQIRRTFEALGYTVTNLHRIQFGAYHLGALRNSHYEVL